MQTLEALQVHYKAVRMRLGCVPSCVVPVKSKVQTYAPPVIEPQHQLELQPDPVAEPVLVHVEIPPTPAQAILKDVAEKHGVTVTEIKNHSHKMKIVKARQEAAYRMKTELCLSLPKIGRVMGKRDHTTILHAIRRYKKQNGIET